MFLQKQNKEDIYKLEMELKRIIEIHEIFGIILNQKEIYEHNKKVMYIKRKIRKLKNKFKTQ